MGSKGSQTVTQTGQQTYTPAAPIGQAGQQAINMAQQAAGAPFQMPVAPVAPFSPFQQLGFGETLSAQGMAQPYFGIGSQYLAGSAAPISGQDVANYYNPMAANVFANLQDIFGQQMRETTGQATQTAGGVGADRIGVAQANLAKQQGLAAGQTASQLYQQALQAAEQQKQMMAGAGYGFGQMGPAAQAAQLQGIGALLGVGGQQQQLTQAQLNALYQNQLAQIAYPFQTAQYLAGITGGLAPAMGGTTAGTQATTQPSPTLAAQLLGIGTAGLGIYGGMGGTFSNPFASTTPTGPTNMSFNTAGLGGGGSYYYQSGGGIDSDYGKLANKAYRKELGDMIPAAEAGNPIADIMMQDIGGSLPMQGGGVPSPVAPPFSGAMPPQRPQWGQISQMMQPPSSPFGGMKGSRIGYQSGGAADTEQPPPFPGASVPKAGGASPIPFISLQPGSGEFHNILKFSSPSTGSGSGSGLGDVAKIASAAAQMLPMLMVARGGGVSPFDVGQPFQAGGDADIIDATDLGPVDVTPPSPEQRKDDATAARLAAQESGSPALGFAGTPPPPTPNPLASPTAFASAQQRSPMTAAPVANADMTAGRYMLPAADRPYPDALQRDWGQNLARSPWMALVKAGAQMAQTRGPIGSVIGAGLGAGAGELEGQRKELRNEQDINLKAEALFQKAQMHLDEYQRETPHQLATEKETERYHDILEQFRIDALSSRGFPGVGTGASGDQVSGFWQFNPQTKKYEFQEGMVQTPKTGSPQSIALQKYLQQNPNAKPEDIAQYIQSLKAPTAAQAARTQGAQTAIGLIDESTKMLDDAIAGKTGPVSGLGGELNRMYQWGRSFVTNEYSTVPSDFQQRMELLQSTLPRVLAATPRISAAERAEFNSIVGGLSRFKTPEEAKNNLLRIRQILAGGGKGETSARPFGVPKEARRGFDLQGNPGWFTDDPDRPGHHLYWGQ